MAEMSRDLTYRNRRSKSFSRQQDKSEMMALYDAYLENIETRKQQGLSAKPIDDGDLLAKLLA